MSDAGGLSPEELAPIRAAFLQECDDLLGELEAGLLALKRGERDPEIVNTVFRAVHSIKGGAASFELLPLAHFAHHFESVLARVRAGELVCDSELLTLLLHASDVLVDHARAAQDGRTVDDERTREIEHALDALVPADDRNALPVDGSTAGADRLDDSAGAGIDRSWIIRFRPHSSLYAKANEPYLMLRELERLGTMSVVLDDREIPTLQELNPEAAHLLWTILLRTSQDEAEIRKIFEFVEGECDLVIAPDPDDLVASPSRGSMDSARRAPAASVSGSHSAEPGGRSAIAPLAENIRVDLDRIDKLVNLVGELVVGQAMVVQRLRATGLIATSGIDVLLEELDQVTRHIQDGVMAIRAQPVKSVFQRMSRVVREVEAATGKQVNLTIEGESTEVDRTVIERLTDPLTHMIRNAVDHGIETPEERLAAHKEAQGTIRISAAHRAGRIVIEVADDGHGIDRARVRAIAGKRGLIAADAELTDHDIDNLIFAPGFSTAASVSEISGRGVGMDVVKSGVQALGGRIVVASKPGEGSTFTLSLPLTLAVLDGMLVTVSDHHLVIPLTAMVEAIQPKPADLQRVGPQAVFLTCHGEHLPLIDLGIALGFRETAIAPEAGVAMLVEDDVGRRAAVLVDEIHGQHQVVIKSIEANYRRVEGIAAATILGDGRVALILDIEAIIASPLRRPTAAERRHATG